LDGVYLITGGLGGLGQLFAREIAALVPDATIILCGRSAAGVKIGENIAAVGAAGGHLQYRQVDVANRAQVSDLIAGVLQDFGRLDGVLHCAGLLRDSFIARKSAEELAEVFAPKVA